MYKNIGFCTFVQTILQSHHSLSHRSLSHHRADA